MSDGTGTRINLETRLAKIELPDRKPDTEPK